MKDNELKRQKIIILVLALLVIILACYIIVSKYKQAAEEEKLEIYSLGLQDGYEQAIIQILQQAVTCQQIPVFYENQTINLIAVDCLQNQSP